MSLAISIRLEYRKPQTAAEKKIFGRTTIEKNGCLATVFINSERSRDGEALNTFFHEMTHVWHHMIGDNKVNRRDSEWSARVVGDTTETLLKALFRRTG